MTWKEGWLNLYLGALHANKLKLKIRILQVCVSLFLFLNGNGKLFDGFCYGITEVQSTTWCHLDHIYQLTKSSYFLPTKVTFSLDKLAVIHWSDCLISRNPWVSYWTCGPRFVSRLWESYQAAISMNIHFSMTVHQLTDRQSECTIQILENMLRVWAWTSSAVGMTTYH